MSVQRPQPNYVQLIETAKLRITSCKLPTARIIQESHEPCVQQKNANTNLREQTNAKTNPAGKQTREPPSPRTNKTRRTKTANKKTTHKTFPSSNTDPCTSSYGRSKFSLPGTFYQPCRTFHVVTPFLVGRVCLPGKDQRHKMHGTAARILLCY